MHELVRTHLLEIAELCRRYHVRRLDVFGSASRGDDFDPARSDVDLLVQYEEEAGVDDRRALEKALESLLGRHVDLIRDGSIRNPYVRRTAEEDRQNLYAAEGYAGSPHAA